MIAVVGMAVSVCCCGWPSGAFRSVLAYAVWTGIGERTFAVGIALYGIRSASSAVLRRLIVAGIIGLKLAHGAG